MDIVFKSHVIINAKVMVLRVHDGLLRLHYARDQNFLNVK